MRERKQFCSYHIDKELTTRWQKSVTTPKKSDRTHGTLTVSDTLSNVYNKSFLTENHHTYLGRITFLKLKFTGCLFHLFTCV